MGREPVDPRTINEATYQPVKHTKGEKTMKWIVSRQRLAEWPKPCSVHLASGDGNRRGRDPARDSHAGRSQGRPGVL
jgi:hypothetical protein